MRHSRKLKKVSEESGLSPELTRSISLEILKIERVRLVLLVSLGTIAFLQAFVTEFLIPPDLRPMKNVFLRFSLVEWGIVIAIATFFEGLVLWFTQIAIRNEKILPNWVPFLGATIELGFPSVLIYQQGPIIHPYFAVHTPFILIYSIFIILSILRLNFFLSTWSGFIAASGYFYAYLQITPQPRPIDNDNYFFAAPLVSLSRAGFIFLSGIIAGFIAYRLRSLLVDTFRHQEEKLGILGVFGQYVSPLVADKLIQQKKKVEEDFNGETREVTVLFLDIRNFTSFSESKPPTEIFEYLNMLFEHFIKIINEKGGMVNKFLGDGILAVFGAPLPHPKHAKQAFLAAEAILKELQRLNQTKEIPFTQIGIGIHSGQAHLGSVGSEERKEYTIIGDTVNLASRIEQLTKEWKTSCLMTEDMWKQIQDDPEVQLYAKDWNWEKLPEFSVRGRQGTVVAWKWMEKISFNPSENSPSIG